MSLPEVGLRVAVGDKYTKEERECVRKRGRFYQEIGGGENTLSVEKEETGNIQGRQGFGKQMFSMHFSPPKSLEC